MAGGLVLKQLPFSPVEIARRVTAALEPMAMEKGIKLRMEGAENLPEKMAGDPERLIEIFTNLVENAIKYTNEGEIVANFRMLDESHWQVAIKDTGAGIAPEYLERIFEPFTQVKGPIITRSQGGVGLGLSITRQLVEMMGGSIEVESALGAGSTFIVTLPVMLQQENES